jgi:hypothetical protein
MRGEPGGRSGVFVQAPHRCPPPSPGIPSLIAAIHRAVRPCRPAGLCARSLLRGSSLQAGTLPLRKTNPMMAPFE